ncbi:DUF6801 domain-containing protein [Actinosynnema sp. NPDC059335]|uniref:DUF6801 domain-containing protein n=1 Tax=Actinosynnema sp. NPDC059335 TaxID=3346804 RepID=UPI0036716CE1
MRKKWSTFRVTALSLASALVAAGALAGAAGPAAAQTTAVRMDYTCTTSAGPTVALTAWVVGGLPDEAGPNSAPSGTYAFLDVDLDLRELRPALPVGSGVRLDGDSTATLDARVVGPDGTRTTRAAFTLAPTWITDVRTTAVRAAGAFPALYLPVPGAYDLRVDDLALTLRPERADGTPFGPTITASCSHDPAQNDLLGTLQALMLHADRPIRPDALHVVSSTPTSVTLAWDARSWWNPTAGYHVYLDGGHVVFVTEKQATITGLTPDKQHRAKVVTVDVKGSWSNPSEGLIFTLPRA